MNQLTFYNRKQLKSVTPSCKGFIHTHVYTPTYIHTCICRHAHTYLPTYLHTCIYTYLPTYLHTCMHASIHSYVFVSCYLYTDHLIHISFVKLQNYFHMSISTYVLSAVPHPDAFRYSMDTQKKGTKTIFFFFSCIFYVKTKGNYLQVLCSRQHKYSFPKASPPTMRGLHLLLGEIYQRKM